MIDRSDEVEAIRAEVERLRGLLRQRDDEIATLTAQRDAANDEANRLTGVDKWSAQDGPRPARDPATGLLGPRIRWDNPPAGGATGSVP